MKTRNILIAALLLATFTIQAQDRFLTRTGHIRFYSEAPMENIEANNHKVLSIVDLSKGQVAVDLLIKAFEFEKKLMQEHFNENYMESEKFPKSTFKGAFTVPDALKSMTDGTYELEVKGDLTIHGVTKPIETKSTLTLKGGKLTGTLRFNVNVKEFDIKIPNVVVKNIAETVEVTANFDYEVYK
uniref:YceI family protein n=1 Tax=Roseivirga sp. TaxID=1964215 RepID=UPI004047E5D0